MSLESELGLKLFRRVGNRYLLTHAGERYVHDFIEIVRQQVSGSPEKDPSSVPFV